MKKLITLLSLGVILTLTSCVKEAQSITIEENGYKVDYLFTQDGIKVYRFHDGYSYHYFTSRGETMTTQQEGKTNHEENIQ